MNKPVYKGWLLVAALVLGPSIASAVGLGKLTVKSLLGQPLNAEIDLVSAPQEELSTLSAQLASLEAYRRSDLQYNAVLTGLRVQIAKRADGQSYVKLISDRTVNDPFVNLLVELKWAAGGLIREYTAFIDPIGYAPTQALVPAATTVVPIPPVAVALPPAAVAVAAPVFVTPPPPAAASVEYGPIKRGETLSRIAFKLKPRGVSLQQMMVGILRNNPDAFINNNMNLLKAEQILHIPEQAQLIALSHADALKAVRLQLTKRSRSGQGKSVVGKPVLRLSGSDTLWPRKGE